MDVSGGPEDLNFVLLSNSELLERKKDDAAYEAREASPDDLNSRWLGGSGKFDKLIYKLLNLSNAIILGFTRKGRPVFPEG